MNNYFIEDFSDLNTLGEFLEMKNIISYCNKISESSIYKNSHQWKNHINSRQCNHCHFSYPDKLFYSDLFRRVAYFCSDCLNKLHYDQCLKYMNVVNKKVSLMFPDKLTIKRNDKMEHNWELMEELLGNNHSVYVCNNEFFIFLTKSCTIRQTLLKDMLEHNKPYNLQ